MEQLLELLSFYQSISSEVEGLKIEAHYIKNHDRLYYVEAKPLISDKEYDFLVRTYNLKLAEIKSSMEELKNQLNSIVISSTNAEGNKLLNDLKQKVSNLSTVVSSLDLKVGSSLGFAYEKKKHKIPMLSLDNTYNINQLKDFLHKVEQTVKSSSLYVSMANKPKMEFLVEEKIDGLSCDIYYEDGKLKEALTRGDGTTGEVITRKVRLIQNVPTTISESDPVHIRGEIVLTFKDYNDIITSSEYSTGKEYKNPRNAAAGIVRAKSSELDHRLSFIAYEVVKDFNDFKKQTDKIDFIKSLSGEYRTPKSFLIDLESPNIIGVLSMIIKDQSEINRDKRSDYPTDGLVFKFNPLEFNQLLGTTSKFPKYAIAYKFEDEEYITTIKDVIWQVGRTGKLTPVVEIEPVEIDGSTITRATAHNLEQMVKLGGIAKGRTIKIKKSAMVIPKIIEVIRDDFSDLFEIEINDIDYPKNCPSCGKPLKIEGPELVCTNKNCPERIIQSIVFFCGRDYMNIEGLSIGIIQKLWDKGLIRSIEDLYNLKDHREELIKMEGFGEKSIDKLLLNIEKSKDNEPYRLISALGYTNIGKTLSKKLMNHFKSLENLSKADELKIRFSGIENIGEVVLLNVLELVRDMPKIIDTFCKKHGINGESKTNLVKSNDLEGKSFMFTGKFQGSRKDYENEIKSRSGNVSSSINKNLSYLVTGDNPTQHKVDKANSIPSIEIISEEKFKDLLGI